MLYLGDDNHTMISVPEKAAILLLLGKEVPQAQIQRWGVALRGGQDGDGEAQLFSNVFQKNQCGSVGHKINSVFVNVHKLESLFFILSYKPMIFARYYMKKIQKNIKIILTEYGVS